MPDAADARVLLDVAPDQYVTERARLVKKARAAKDRETATFYQSLKRPSVGLWAVLAAGIDRGAVDKTLAATSSLADIQAGGSAAAAITTATRSRRKEIEAFVDSAVKALARFDAGAEKRRPEIRAIVDQLSRHPELAESWADASLRDLPEDEFGFGSFAGMEMTSSPKPAASKKETKSQRAAAGPKVSKADKDAEREARVAGAEALRRARHEVAVAARELSTADRELDAARTALRKAEKAVQLAEDNRAAADERHTAAEHAAEQAKAEN